MESVVEPEDICESHESIHLYLSDRLLSSDNWVGESALFLTLKLLDFPESDIYTVKSSLTIIFDDLRLP